MDDPLLAFREEFPILERTTYLVSHSLGPMPRTVPARLAEYADHWGTHGVRAWNFGWWDLPVTAGNAIAPLLCAADGEVVMLPNVSLAQSVVLSALDFPADRNEIVMTELDFPSVLYAFDALAPRFGARITRVPSSDGITLDMDRLLSAITERTRLVAISHVLFRSAFIVDAAAVCARAREVGALVSLDAFHSVGIMPVDVHSLGVDFLTGGVLKWLCGGPGGCFLYVSPAVRDTLAPAITGWQAHARPFEFEPQHDLTSGPFRWLNGTPVIPALYAAVEGPRIVARAGVEAIRAKSTRQTSRLIELAGERGYRVHAPGDPERRGGTVAVDVPNAFAVAQALLERDVLVDFRAGAGIRIAPHFFTRDDEIDAVVAAVDEILATGAWQKHAGRTAVVT
ncbi:MAG TPA: aminotransferase class V-fold PLP-dependent enzyme [Gemmatimonadaceae bacterium]|nr:aminotransferase class V-fold PLP-dependent enzyme [Gemmatimonadaceae bacterium]